MTLLSYGTKEWIDEEARAHGGSRRFTCPKCKVKKNDYCKARSNSHFGFVHKEREDLWKQYCSMAPRKLAWIEDMALPWFMHLIEEYVVGGKRPKRRKIDIEIALKRIQETKLLLSEAKS